MLGSSYAKGDRELSNSHQSMEIKNFVGSLVLIDRVKKQPKSFLSAIYDFALPQLSLVMAFFCWYASVSVLVVWRTLRKNASIYAPFTSSKNIAVASTTVAPFAVQRRALNTSSLK